MRIKKIWKTLTARVNVYVLTYDASKTLVGVFFVEYWKLIKYFYNLKPKKKKKDNWEYRR